MSGVRCMRMLGSHPLDAVDRRLVGQQHYFRDFQASLSPGNSSTST